MNRRTPPLAIVLVLSLAAFAALPAAGAEPAIQKRAFLVGVAKYRKAGLTNLKYPEDDMRELGEELAKHGFKVTTVLGNDATQANVTAALDKFIADLRDLDKTDVALIAFSGHGVQKQTQRDGRLDEDAFYCPVDALTDDETTMISIGQLMDRLQSKSGSLQNLVLVDACRNNPAKGAKGIDGSTARNLGNKISVLFSSTDGALSFESEKAKHGVFTHVLLEGLRGGASDRSGEVAWLNLASYVMNQVPRRAPDLLDDPNAEQFPNLIGNLVRQPVLARIEVKLPESEEKRKEIEFSRNVVEEARKAREDSRKLLEKTRKKGEETPAPSKAESEITNSIGMKLKLIPGGEFVMGPERRATQIPVQQTPAHKVSITRPFYLGAYEVTHGQFAKFIKETDYKTEAEKDGRGWGWNGEYFTQKPEYTWRKTGFPQSDEHPVVNISWRDATEFLRWLSVKEGAQYRLPTEAEWEYACRADRYSLESDPRSLAKVGNIADATAKAKLIKSNPAGSYRTAHDSFVFTAPVGKFAANEFGLFDMVGNVAEWCQDWYSDNYYAESPAADPPGPSSGILHVIRGCSFSSEGPVFEYPFARWGDFSGSCFVGFRAAKSP